MTCATREDHAVDVAAACAGVVKGPEDAGCGAFGLVCVSTVAGAASSNAPAIAIFAAELVAALAAPSAAAAAAVPLALPPL